MIQEGPFYAEPGNDGSIVITLVSTVPLDPDVLIVQLVGNSSPGFLDNAATSAVGPANQQNWETVMFAETDIRVLNSQITPNTDGICQVIESKQSGSLAAYCYRYTICSKDGCRLREFLYDYIDFNTGIKSYHTWYGW